MRYCYLFIILSIALFTNKAFAQTSADYAVQLSAVTQENPAGITLSWSTVNDTACYIYRKAKTDVAWGVPIAVVHNATTYTDMNVIADSGYEYQVIAYDTVIVATGYIYAGIKLPAVHNKGTLLLLVDSTFTDSCSAGIYRMMQDLSGDGWQLIRHDIARSLPDTAVKAQIIADYQSTADLRAVMILGHVAVPYSGDLNPDGHQNHLGAWPADVYYACLGGIWTDSVVNDISAGYEPNHNVPGDGKWDQTEIPAPTELQISRIDFYDMPAFNKTEIQLMNSYLSRDHMYKMDSIYVDHRAIINDNFGAFGGEAFAANGWRNFAPLVSRDSVSTVPLIASVNDSGYQWTYGCGGGSFVGASGIGSTDDIAANNFNSIFVQLFGSYFGDWNTTNDFLRAPLCANVPALTDCWAGRPNWYFHHMALGENIGYSARLTQNNTDYFYLPASYGTQFVHIALMGDLSLRTDYIQPPQNITLTAPVNTAPAISWLASADTAVIGYYVYRSMAQFGHYDRISALIAGTAFTDTATLNGLYYYMVRAAKLQLTPSGSYYNLSVGIADSVTANHIDTPLAVTQVTDNFSVSLFPSPAANELNVILTTQKATPATLTIINYYGQKLMSASRKLKTGETSFSFNVGNLPAGVYLLQAEVDGRSLSKKWTKL